MFYPTDPRSRPSAAGLKPSVKLAAGVTGSQPTSSSRAISFERGSCGEARGVRSSVRVVPRPKPTPKLSGRQLVTSIDVQFFRDDDAKITVGAEHVFIGDVQAVHEAVGAFVAEGDVSPFLCKTVWG